MLLLHGGRHRVGKKEELSLMMTMMRRRRRRCAKKCTRQKNCFLRIIRYGVVCGEEGKLN